MEQGTASFSLEGLVPGTHVVTMEIGADLERPGRDVLPLAGRLKAAVEVVDARFNLTFNHPDVVREGEPYTLYVTITNVSPSAFEQGVSVSLEADRILGALKEDTNDAFVRPIGTLNPGEGATVEFRLVADITGRCVATTYQSSSMEGHIQLTTGVGEQGIPLSPSSLVLPRFTELLPEALVRPNVRLLGLAYSLAVAPPGSIPQSLPRLVTSDVERRAVDLAEAGQRLYLGDERLPSLETLLLDQLGSRHDLPEYDQLRRTLTKGRDAAEALASLLRQEQEAQSLSASALLGHAVSTMSYAQPWLAATFESAGAGEAPTLEARKLNGITGVTYLAYPAGDGRALRSLPFGEIYDVFDTPGGARAPLAVIGRLSSEAGYAFVVHGPSSGSSMPVNLSLVAPAPSGSGFVRVDLGSLTVPAGEAWAVQAVLPAGNSSPLTFELVHLATGFPVAGAPAPVVRPVDLPPFALVGARQDFILDPYGSGVWYLFNRPPARADAEAEDRYAVETSFRGLDTTPSGTLVTRSATFSAASALWQPSSERVVAVRFAQPVSAISALHEGQPVVSHIHHLDAPGLRDTFGNPLSSLVPAIQAEGGHVGGLVEGTVLRGTGDAVVGATVRLVRDRVIPNDAGADPLVLHDLVAERTTGADGTFFFPFIEEPILSVPRPREKGAVQSGFRIRAIVPPGPDPLAPEETEEVSSIIRLQSRLARINIALLGRGSVTGQVLYDNGDAVAAAAVTAASTLFSEVRSAIAGTDGVFRIDGLPVGPITLTARDATGRSTYATVGLAAPGATATVTLRLERTQPVRTGTVTGRVQVRRDPASGSYTEPAPGATVAVYSAGAPYGWATTGSTGSFRFETVPAGRVTVQAADFSISRTPALVDLDLAPDATEEVTLTLAASNPRAVVGRILFRDPLTQVDIPVSGATVFIEGPGSSAVTNAEGDYRIDGVPAQGTTESPYRVHAIDFARSTEGTTLVAVTDASPDPVVAATIVLTSTSTGAIDGVVLDPLGRPAPGVTLTLLPIGETMTGADGTFSFEGVPLSEYTVAAHKGTGLEPSAIGWIGAAGTRVLFGGHRAFVTVRLRGAGTVNVRTRTASAGVRSPVAYKPTWFSPQELVIRQKAAGIEATTDDDGRLTLVLPVGPLSITAANPFHGAASFGGSIDFAGQVKDVDLLFQESSAVTGIVVDVDGITPVPGIDVELGADGLLPQRQRSDALGAFRFELVPPGAVSVTALGLRGAIERTGRTYGRISEPGQVLDLVVRLKPKGTIRGHVVDETTPGVFTPLAGAQVFLQENDFPFRRFPASPGFLSAGNDGRFEFAGVAAGRFTVVARDPGQVARQGSRYGDLNADFEVVDIGAVALSGQVANLNVLVRDPENGSPVPDAQVFLSNGEATVAGADGRAFFPALPLGTWAVHAFHAPTGRGGRLGDIQLATAGQELQVVVVLDQRGRISGVLFDDEARTVPVGGGMVRLQGTVNGRLWGASLTALASTSREAGSVGTFAFDGLPVAVYGLTAGVEGSARQASESVALTPTAPEAQVALVLEPVRDVWVRLFQTEQVRGLVEVNPDPVNGDGVFAVVCSRSGAPKVNLLAPEIPYPGHAFAFREILATRSFEISVQEASGELRRASVTSDALASGSAGAGTSTDPYRVVLLARGTVRVTVRDAGGVLVAGATVRVHSSNGTFETATDGSGRAAFTAVEEGQVTVSAHVPASTLGASASRTLQWDDQVLDLDLTLSPVVSAHGVVYEAPEGDAWDGNVAGLTPAAGIAVRIHPAAGAEQLLLTAADGTFHFSALSPGAYTIEAQSLDGERIASAAGSLGSAHGTDYALAALVLDASRPRIVSLTPPNGEPFVSRTAPVEIVFSEPLASTVLPSGPASAYFQLAYSGTPAAGVWSSTIDAAGRQVIRFTPNPRYENSTIYSLLIKGGPGGVRDREGRPLTDSGDIGSSFTTSDTDGPRVVGTLPSLAHPVDPEASIRIDFGEVLVLTPAQITAAVLFEWRNLEGVWAAFPVTTSLTRGGYSILVAPPQGVTFTGDSLRRRLTVSGLTDAFGNPMPVWVGEYRIYDTNAPTLTIGLPPNAPGGDLAASASYTLTPAFDNLDDVTPENPFGDVDRVEYSFASAADPSQPAASPGVVMTLSPFALGFVASYSGDGVLPRPFPVWVKAFDTSGNPSGQVRLDMRVLPNTPPIIGSVGVAATAPVAGIPYAGSSLSATASGIADADDARLTLSAELRRTVASGSEQIAAAPARTLDRPAEGWAALPQQAFSFVVPISEAEGNALFVRVLATDTKGAQASADTPFVVADDATAPVVTDLVARRPSGDSATAFVIGDTFVLEVRARDLETAVRSVSFATTGGVLPESLVATRIGTSDTFRSPSVTVPSSLTEPVSVEVTATCEDFGGNPRSATVTLELAPSSDPTKPVAEWLSPFEGALWPAAYASVDGAKNGVDLLLRVRVTDKDLDGTGQEIPGAYVNVKVRGPIDANATLATEWTTAALLSSAAGEWVYEAAWRVPNGVAAGVSLPFEVEVIDAGANRVVRPVTLHVVPARYVYESATTAVVSTSDVPKPVGTESLPVFLLDGTILSLYPPTAGGARSFESLHLYSGGAWSAGPGSPVTVRMTTLTSPEVTIHDSLVPYYPLELSIGETLAVGHGAAIDVTERGLLGGDGSHDPVTLAGERGSAPGAAGSHGGSGHPTNDERLAHLEDAGSVYGNIRDPRLPGSGGGRWGGTGGGVIRVDAPAATVRLFGDLAASGQVPSDRAGAAGGSIRLQVARLEGRGSVRANGSASEVGVYRPGGGGGRVSVSWREPSAPTIQVEAQGATSLFGISDPFSPPGGAGTVFLERLDGSGQALDRGTLLVSNRPSTYPPALTPLPGLGAGTVTAVDPATGVLTVLAPSATASIAGEQLVATISPTGGGSPTILVLPVTAQTRTGGAFGSSDQTFDLTVSATEAQLTALSSALAASATVTAKGRLSYAVFEGRGAVRAVSADELEVGGIIDQRSALVLDSAARVLFGGEGPGTVFDGTAPAPGSTVAGNATIDVQFKVVDPVGLSKVEETWSPAGTTRTRTFSEPLEVLASPTPTRVTVPAGQPAGPVTYRVRATDRAGRVSESTATWNVVGDSTPPTLDGIDLTPQRTGDTYVAGDTITVRARATDNVALAKVRIELDGRIAESATSPATLAWLALPVAASTAFTVSVTATDLAGNVTPGSRTITVIPRADSAPPTVAFDCSSAGALLPSDYKSYSLQATASDDQGVHHVEVYRDADATPFATFFAANGSTRSFPINATGITLPVVTEPTTVRFRVRAFDFGGNASAEVQTEITVVPAVEISATGANDWPALVNQTAYLATGTLVLDQPRTFRDLLVLRGASVTHSAGGNQRLDLTVTGSLFIECGGSIDVTGRGYPTQSTYPNLGTTGVTSAAGSHLGVGGVYVGGHTTLLTYGSVRQPQEAGSGGFGSFAKAGGGVVRIQAGAVVFGGANASIVASGGGTYAFEIDNAGAGGSVWIKAASITGDGLIGAVGGGAYYSRGGGGAVAIEYGTTSGTVLSGANAKGSLNGTSIWNGGAGTVVLKGPGATHGTLRVDNRGTAGQQTVLPSLGFGTALYGTVGATLVTNRGTTIPPYFAGHWVEITRGGSLLGTWRIGAISDQTVTLEPNESEVLDLHVEDHWQGVYRFDEVEVKGNAVLRSDDPVRVTTVNLSGPTTAGSYTEVTVPLAAEIVSVTGNVSIPGITAPSLTVKTGTKLTHPASTAAEARSLNLNVSGTLTIEDGASIDVTGRGYPAQATYPNLGTTGVTNAAGSHLGVGGVEDGRTTLLTFGSVRQPQEAGSGGFGSGAQAGGGVVRIQAGAVVFGGANASIVASGGGTYAYGTDNAGAGGSVWIKAASITGDGVIGAVGGEAYYSRGGGGAVAIEYETTSGTVLSGANAKGSLSGTSIRNGGAGTVVLKGPGATHGTLRVDNRETTGQATVLPSLGSGTALSGTVGATLVTNRGTAIPPYFAGHWVEITRGGSLLGTWRIGTISNQTVTLEPNEGEVLDLHDEDHWQGVYRFDAVEVKGNAGLRSDDPVRVTTANLTGPTTAGSYMEITVPLAAETVSVTGNVSIPGITATALTVKAGATLTHPASTTTEARRLDLKVSGTLTIENAGSIDVTGRGYLARATYPGATGEPAPTSSAGSHIGTGGLYYSLATAPTYGSVERPREAGSGCQSAADSKPGGGVIRIEAGTVMLGGATAKIIANGGGGYWIGGAGGSIWITAGTVTGDGLIEAAGGTGSQARGGGGAVAIEYGIATGTALTRVNAKGGSGGSATANGGAGTVVLKGPGATYGTLRVDNLLATGQTTVLPSLGSGTAQGMTSGATLDTGLSTAVPPYFAGHWVEITRGGSLLGTWRIGTISNQTVTLEPNEGEVLDLHVEDLWQGVYRFDAVELVGGLVLESDDPIRSPLTIVTGHVALDRITTTALTVKAGATLTHPASTTTKARSLDLKVSGTMTIEDGGSIDVTGRGYAGGATYPGETRSSTKAGGSHLGSGGSDSGASGASTFGSVVRPQEAGSGGWGSFQVWPGGGVVHIEAGEIALGGAMAKILANGAGESYGTGAGGSIWITTGTLAGDGLIEAAGGLGYYRGGGGAVAIEYGTSEGTALTRVNARGGGSGTAVQNGGAGTVVLKGPGATHGTLRIDNLGTTGQATVLPSLGRGTAQDLTSGATLVTDRSTAIPPYFAGHWLEITRGGVLLGTWRVETISDRTVTLQPNAAETLALQPGDHWQGVYRFDSATVSGGAVLSSADPVRGCLPTISVSSPTAQTTFGSGADIPVTFAAADDCGIANVTLTLGSSSVVIPGPYPSSRTIRAPWLTTTSTLELVATVLGRGGQSVSTSVSLTVLAAPPLNARFFEPVSGSALYGGTNQVVRVALSDRRPIRQLTLTLGSSVLPFSGLTGQILSVVLPIPVVAADETTTLVATVEDDMGLTVSSAPVAVTILADSNPRVTSSVNVTSPVAAGASVTTAFTGISRDTGSATMTLRVTGSVTHEETLFARPSGGMGAVTALDAGQVWTGSFSPFAIPRDARGPMTITVTAVDAVGRTGSALPILREVVAPQDVAPTVEFAEPTAPAGATVAGGDMLTARVSVNDDGPMTRLTVTLGPNTAGVLDPGTGIHTLIVPVLEVTSDQTMELTARVEDDLGLVGTAGPVPIRILTSSVPRVTATAEPAGPYEPGGSITVSYDALAIRGARTATLTISGALTHTESISLSGQHTAITGSFAPIVIPADAHGNATAVVRVEDDAGQTGAAPDLSLQIGPESQLSATLAGPATVAPGSELELILTATDDIGLRSARLSVSGAFEYARLITLGPTGAGEATNVTRTIRVPVPASVLGPVTASVEVLNSENESITTDQVSTTIVDTTAPAVTRIRTYQQVLLSGTSTYLAADVSDGGRIAEVRFLVDGILVGTLTDPSRASTYQIDGYTPPSVSQHSSVLVRVEAVDGAGNEGAEERTFVVLPAGSARVRFQVPTNGAIGIPGGIVPMRVSIDSQVEVAAIRYEANGVPVGVPATAESGFGQDLVVPAATPGGTSIALAAVALDASGVELGRAETALSVIAPAAVRGSGVPGDTGILEATDASLDGQSLVVFGSLSVAGAHSFSSLVIQPESALFSLRLPGGGTAGVDVTVTGDLYVARRGAISAGRHGYEGGYQGSNAGSAVGRTYPGLQGSADGAGGSHGGRGGLGVGEPGGPVFGSVQTPTTAGSGGGANGADPGGSGGGVIRLEVGGRLIVDGEIWAEGEGGSRGGCGAGGSVLVEATRIEGAGYLAALGGTPWLGAGARGDAGGGRIALHGELSAEAPGLWVASGSQWFDSGAPGTGFLKQAGDLHGHLAIDSWPSEQPAITELPAVGSGSVSFAQGRTIRGSSTSWVPGIEDVLVEVRRGSEYVGRFRIESLDLASQTLTLEQDADGQVAVGDVYQGVRLFDSVTITGRTRMTTADVVEGRLLVDETAGFESSNTSLPPVDSSPTIAMEVSATTVKPGSSLSVTTHAQDGQGLSLLVVRLDIAESAPTEIPLDASGTAPTSDDRTTVITVPADAVDGEYLLHATVRDTYGSWTGTAIMLTVARTMPPQIAGIRICPTDGHALVQGGRLEVCVDAASALPVDRYRLEASGSFSFSEERADGCFPGIVIPPDATSGSVLFKATVVDVEGVSADGSTTATVHQDQRVPAVVSTFPPAGSVVYSGQQVVVGAEVWDDVRVDWVEVNAGGVSLQAAPGAGDRWEATWTVPEVASPTPIDASLFIADGKGNGTWRNFSLTVNPASLPAVGFVLPTSGALAVAGSGVDLTLRASAASETISKVELFVEGAATPVATLTTPEADGLYRMTYTVDGLADDGVALPLVARATAAGGAFAEATLGLTVVRADILVSADRVFEEGSVELTPDTTLVCAGGTTTLPAQTTLRRLVVLPGATVTHAAADARGLDLGVEDLFVAAGATIDVRGKGYPGGLTAANSLVEGLSPDGPAGAPGIGGTHVGRGAAGDPGVGGEAEASYGSLHEAYFPGAGGGGLSDGLPREGGDGGGLIRLSAERAVIDGLVTGAGKASSAGAGAGGAIRFLTWTGILGAGRVEALGGDGGGGGGMIALPWGGVDFGVAVASGGLGPDGALGGAGSVSRGAHREELWFDNGRPERGDTVAALTDPAGIGSGTVTEVEGLDVRAAGSTWRRGVIGESVRITRAGVTVGTFFVEDFDSATSTIRLEEAARGQVLPGDACRGSVGIASLFVRGRARLAFSDDLLRGDGSPSYVEVDSSSTLVAPGVSILEPPAESCEPRLPSSLPNHESSLLKQGLDTNRRRPQVVLPPSARPGIQLFP